MSSRRRRSRRERRRSWLSGYTLWAAGAVLAIIIMAPIVVNLVRSDETPEILQGVVEELPDQGNQHVQQGTSVEYDTDPPTSGSHYPIWADTGFHTEPIQYEILVHNLEHGNIVIYYDPAKITNETTEALGQLTSQYTGTWDAVIAVPRQDDQFEVILTAWNHRLRLESWDQEMADAFIDEYRGRGPENPVR
jgi:hypothetical protein